MWSLPRQRSLLGFSVGHPLLDSGLAPAKTPLLIDQNETRGNGNTVVCCCVVVVAVAAVPSSPKQMRLVVTYLTRWTRSILRLCDCGHHQKTQGLYFACLSAGVNDLESSKKAYEALRSDNRPQGVRQDEWR